MIRYFKVSTDKSPLSYKTGEEMIFNIEAFEDEKRLTNQKIIYILTGDDGKKCEGIANPDNNGDIKISFSCDRPGFVRLVVKAIKDDYTPEEGFDPCEAGAGADVSEITYHGSIPDNFHEYWNGIERLVEKFTPKALIMEPYRKNVPDKFECFDFRLSSPDGTGMVSGFLTYPKATGKYPICVRFKGYGVSGCFDPFYADNTIYAIINAHGIENGFSVEATKEKYPNLLNYGFDKTENQRPETTYWQNMIIRDLVGVKYLKSLPIWDGKHLKIEGGSQGAFQAAAVAAHDACVTELLLEIPWFCDLHAEEFGYQAGWRPKPGNGLDYFDTVASVMQVKCPVEIKAGLGDYICPPTTTMALYNSANAPKSIEYMQCEMHGFWPRENIRECFRLEDKY